jgi:hypothetical protein
MSNKNQSTKKGTIMQGLQIQYMQSRGGKHLRVLLRGVALPQSMALLVPVGAAMCSLECCLKMAGTSEAKDGTEATCFKHTQTSPHLGNSGGRNRIIYYMVSCFQKSDNWFSI